MKPITIIGGGLAGLTLGILLRRENVPVDLVEAGKYPRHRVCGEFISGRGRKILEDIDCGSDLATRDAADCAFYLGNRSPIKFRLHEPALCVSRFDLDAFLAEKFQRSGGALKTESRFTSPSSEPGQVFATGRRRAENASGHLIGLKSHAPQASQTSDLEMHFTQNAYWGLNRLPNGSVNVCGLLKLQGSAPNLRESWSAILNSHQASLDSDSFCSVAGLTLDSDPPDHARFVVGDAAAMIPPLTGNGMSMAFESAEAAAPFLLQYAKGHLGWSDALAAHMRFWRSTFSARLKWAAFLQKLAFSASGQRLFFLGAKTVPGLSQFFFSRTRA